MHVDAAVFRYVQDGGREYHAVRRNAYDIGRKRGEIVLLGFVAQRFGAAHLDAVPLGNTLHGRRNRFGSPSAHGVGARIGGYDLVLLHKVLKDGCREFGRAHEDYSHCPGPVSPGFAPFASATSYALSASILVMGSQTSNMVLPSR